MNSSKNKQVSLAAGQMNNNTKLFFLLANQLPFIALSDQSASVSPGISHFIKNYDDINLARKTNTPWIIAISDPNDCLSYPIFSQWRQAHKNTFASVFTRVQTTSYWIPGIGWITNPVYAHLGYGRDEKVINLIMNGYKASNKD